MVDPITVSVLARQPLGLQVKGAAIFESPPRTVLIRQIERASVMSHGWLDIELG